MGCFGNDTKSTRFCGLYCLHDDQIQFFYKRRQCRRELSFHPEHFHPKVPHRHEANISPCFLWKYVCVAQAAPPSQNHLSKSTSHVLTQSPCSNTDKNTSVTYTWTAYFFYNSNKTWQNSDRNTRVWETLPATLLTQARISLIFYLCVPCVFQIDLSVFFGCPVENVSYVVLANFQPPTRANMHHVCSGKGTKGTCIPSLV